MAAVAAFFASRSAFAASRTAFSALATSSTVRGAVNGRHGSTRRHKVGTVLVGEPRETEFSSRVSSDGAGFEELVESLRLEQAPSRLQGRASSARTPSMTSAA